MFSSTNYTARDGRYLVNQLKYKKPYKKRGEDGPFINLCPSTWSKWKLCIFHSPKHITYRLYQNTESYPPDLQRFVEILYPRSSSTTSGTGLVTLQAGFTVPKGASVRSSCPLLKHQKNRCFTPIRPTQTPIRKSPIFWGASILRNFVGVLLLHDSDANSW